MSRLADYFFVIGVEDKSDLQDGKELRGCVDQRFPENDWKDAVCPQGLEHFCQPGGWFSSKTYKPPSFYVCILTDMEGKPSYLASLCFKESVYLEAPVYVNSETLEETGSEEKKPAVLYVPKCLCIVSRQRYFNTLKNCLSTIFAAYMNGDTELIEKMIGCMLGFVHVPPPGGPKLTFSIGGGDSQVLQPPLSNDLPCTSESVAVLFNQLGINSMLLVFTALVTECKILLLSSSYTHLTMAAEALVALLYPLKFSYVFIPVLPASLLDFLTAPTPFLMGVHMSYEDQIPELFDVVVVNIDEGYVTVPDTIHLATIPEPYYTHVLKSLKMILTPSLFTSDLLYPIHDSHQTLALQDKQLRAVFIKLFAEMFTGYRSCLTLIRVHPLPVISFNKLAFMERRGFVGDEFFSKVLESVGFSSMTQARGPPYRPIDMFDELVAKIVPSNHDKTVDELLNELIPIVDHLCQNEPWFDNPEVSTVPVVPAERLKSPFTPFPLLNEIDINSYLTKNNESPHKTFQVPVKELQKVPISSYDLPVTHFINQRRLEVIQDCIQYIYENKTSDALKALPSVLRALKSKGAQFALCNELEMRLRNEKGALLTHDQYNLIVRLINTALQDDSTVNSIVIAAKIVPLASAFQRKLGPSAIQFAYTSIQDHAIWSNLHFWEEAFYMEAQRQIVELHVNERLKRLKEKEKRDAKNHKKTNQLITNDVHDSVKKVVSDGDVMKNKQYSVNENPRNSMIIASTTPQIRTRTMTTNTRLNSQIESPEKKTVLKDMPDAMKLAAELLSEWEEKSEEEKERLIYEEESIVYSLTMLFSQRMMYLRVPENACVEMRRIELARQAKERRLQQQMALAATGDSPQSSAPTTDDNMSLSAKPSYSVVTTESTRYGDSVPDSTDWGSVQDFDGREIGESPKDATSKFILRFVERVCTEAGVTPQHLKALQTNIPMLVGMHIELLEEVYRELKDAPLQKVKIMRPSLLPGETTQFDGLRCYLVPDGRELGVRFELPIVMENKEGETDINIQDINIGGPCLLPAEGALFVTNYRVIFRGTPVDQFASEMTVTRSFPVGSLMKVKKFSEHVHVQNGIDIPGYLQLRSSTMQMMKLAFDEEVQLDVIENLQKALIKLRWPLSVYNTFAFNYKAPPVLQRTLSQRQQSIKKTHRTLTNVVSLSKRTGSYKNKAKTAIAEDNTMRKYKAITTDGSVDSFEDDDSSQRVLIEQEHRGADRLRQSPLCRDYDRLGFGEITKSSTSSWRLSMANFHYTVCRSYPAIVVIPSKVADDMILKVAKNHKLNRFPVAIWRNKRTKGTLLRCGTVAKNILSAVLRASLVHNGVQVNLNTNVTDDEKYFTEIVKASQLHTYKGKTQSVSYGAAFSMHALANDFGSLLDGSDHFSKRIADEKSQMSQWEPANLYVVTDKAGGAKGGKMESSSKIVVVNVDIHDINQVKVSFNKLSKVCCSSSEHIEKNFLPLLEESKWLSQISSLLQVASAVVNLIDIQGSSCVVSLGDGAEITSQVVSLVQVLSDPYYRTIEGFKVLIEKDWLAFGYRFSYRGSHTQEKQKIAPLFLQFLDCVYQILLQYPHAFEFNNYFLKLIAYHQTSMRFNTFFLDSEHERYQHGWFPDSEQKSKERNSVGKLPPTKANIGRSKRDAILKAEQLAQQQREQKQKKSKSVSLWDYLELQSTKLTLLQSFSYHPNLQKGVLQPFCNISNLEIWDYYTAENLYTGPTYDLELISDFEMANPSNETSLTSTNNSPDIDREDSQRCLTGCYGTTQDFPRDEVSYLLYELSRLKEELDQQTTQWRNTWDSLDVKKVLSSYTRSMSWQDFWTKGRKLAMHKRATIDLVLKGKSTENGQIGGEFGFDHPHNFVVHNYILPSVCNYCVTNISGIHAGFRCSQCGYNVHDRCLTMAPGHCPKHPSLIDQPTSEISRSVHSLHGEKTNPRNFKGTLYKRGNNFMKQWKARWFVLDTEKNLLTYYDSEENPQLQGRINLEEMRGCRPVHPLPGAPKSADSRSFIELETTKRTYHLYALNSDAAQEWIERLNALNV